MPEGKNKLEDWRTLSELASKEQDSEKLLQLVQKLNQVLDTNDNRTDGQSGEVGDSTAA